MRFPIDNWQSRVTRRQVLKGAAAGAALLSFGSRGRAWAVCSDPAWGCLPSDLWTWAADFHGYKILELHLFGGMAPYESFYYRDVVGSRTRGFDTEVTNLNWNPACANTPSGLETLQFSTDSSSKPIHLGPFSKPLWRPDIHSRTRVIVQRHNLLPHEAAIPLAMTGHRLGRPNLAPLGAAIQHRRSALDTVAGSSRTLPHSYALLPQNGALGSLFTLVQQVQSSIGTHPGEAKPLVLRIGPGLGDFISQLDRMNLGATKDGVNALIDQFRGQYRDRLRWPPVNAPARSVAFSDYDTASARLLNADTLQSLLSGAPQTIDPSDTCAREAADPFSSPANPTRTALEFAAFLLTQPPAEAASSVFVLDSGLVRTFLPYDVHSNDHAGDTGSNLWNLLDALVSLIRDPANPTPEDPGKIDLDDTMIIINTEFGRTPFKSSGMAPEPLSLGRDHWPDASVAVLIGGPIPAVAAEAPNRVVGSISDGADETVAADIPFSSTDMRAAALVAAGVNPFENENFALGSLTASLVGADHEATMVNLRQMLLGVA